VVAALLASVIGGLLAIALSLPLRSPDDVFFNAGTVAVGALVAGLAAGAAWRAFGGHIARFEVAMAGAFVLVATATFAGTQLFAGMVPFVLPLAAVVLGSIAALTPLIADRAPPIKAVAAVVPMLVLGVALAGRGDAEIRALSLPPAATAALATPGASSAGTSTFRTPADVRGVMFTVGQGSEARFTVREKLAEVALPGDATLHDTALTGEVRLDGTSTVRIDLQQLSSDQSRRDTFIRRQFSRQSIATVTIDNIGALPAQYAAGEVVKRQVTGRLNILGNEAPITFEVEARLEGDTLSILGRTTFRWADFKIPPPNIPGTVQVQDEVTVVVLIVAKAA
jgi:hypothetical protein